MAEDALPRAEEVLAPVRMNQFAADVALAGRLRIGSKRLPFTIRFTDGAVVYAFADPTEVLRLRQTESGPILEREKDGKSETVEGKAAREPFRGTDITLEDISLRFLFWRDAEVKGEQIIGPRSTWKVRLTAPNRGSNYAAVNAWIDKESGGLARVDAYDWNGKFVKRFKVVTVQKIDGLWALKQMRVEAMKPGTKKVLSRTYVEIKGKAE